MKNLETVPRNVWVLIVASAHGGEAVRELGDANAVTEAEATLRAAEMMETWDLENTARATLFRAVMTWRPQR